MLSSRTNTHLMSLVRQLSGCRSVNNSTTLITMYVPGSTRHSDVTKMITAEISKAPNIKSRQTRQGIQDALQSVSSQLKRFGTFPANGVVILAGTTTEGQQSLTIEPPRPIDRFFYRCDTLFYL